MVILIFIILFISSSLKNSIIVTLVWNDSYLVKL